MSKKINPEQIEALASAYIWAEYLETYRKWLQGDALRAWQTTLGEAIETAESLGVSCGLIGGAVNLARGRGGGFDALWGLLLGKGYTLK